MLFPVRPPVSPISIGGAVLGIVSGALIEYRFDDGTGQVLTDYSGNAWHAQLGLTSGSDAKDPTWTAEGLTFVRTANQHVQQLTITDTPFLGALSVCIVAKLAYGVAAGQLLAGKRLTDANSPLFFRSTPTDILEQRRGNPGGSRLWNGPAIVGAGLWGMYSVVCPDALVETAPVFYVGATGTTGSLSSGTGTGAPTGVSTVLGLGANPAGGTGVEGQIAYAVIYARALTGAEIFQNYSALKRVLAPRGVSF